MTFAQTLKTTRTAATLSQIGAYSLCNIPKRTWQDWEAGKRIPPIYVQESVISKLQDHQGT